jgi:hypothetical protein
MLNLRKHPPRTCHSPAALYHGRGSVSAQGQGGGGAHDLDRARAPEARRWPRALPRGAPSSARQTAYLQFAASWPARSAAAPVQILPFSSP